MVLSFLSSLFIAQSLLRLPQLAFADLPSYENNLVYEDGLYGSVPSQTFLSDPSIIAPVANVLTPPKDGVSTSRHIVWTPVGGAVQAPAPMILDATSLALVYKAPEANHRHIGGHIQTCNNTDYLTWWSGDDSQHRMTGRQIMMNSTYDIVYNFTAIDLPWLGPDGRSTVESEAIINGQDTNDVSRDYPPVGADAHEFFLTPHCTAIITAYQPRKYDLSAYNISTGYLMDNLFQEIDLATNELIFQWRASDFINISQSYVNATIVGSGLEVDRGFDFFHINSVEKDHRGNYLVSSRHMHSIYYIEGPRGIAPGTILWTLGGQRNDFSDPSGSGALDWGWQHHVRWTSSNLDSISLFDNSNAEVTKKAMHPVSRGMIISLDFEHRTAKLERSYDATTMISAVREGSMQVLPDTHGNVMLGYGQEPGYTEFSANGTVLHDVRFGPMRLNRESADNYRAMKVNWTGAPSWGPRIAAGPSPEVLHEHAYTSFRPYFKDLEATTNNTAYFSWNGATEVVEWLILASNDSQELNSTRHIWNRLPRAGFETSVSVGSSAFVRAVALAADHRVMDATPVLNMRTASVEFTAWDPASLQTELNNIHSDVSLSYRVRAGLRDIWKYIAVAFIFVGLLLVIVGSRASSKGRGWMAALGSPGQANPSRDDVAYEKLESGSGNDYDEDDDGPGVLDRN